MFSGISTDGPFGGGEGEEMFRSLMIDQYGKAIEAARRLRPGQRRDQRQLLKHQETPPVSNERGQIEDEPRIERLIPWPSG